MDKPKTTDIEICVAEYFHPRVNLVVPNVSWGLSLSHECDLLVLTKAGYAYEVEIKVSAADLKADLKKSHGHYSPKIKKLFFAIPECLLKYREFIPKDAGILVVWRTDELHGWRVRKERDAIGFGNYKFSDSQKFQFARLGALRIFPLKRALRDSCRNYHSLRNKLNPQ